MGDVWNLVATHESHHWNRIASYAYKHRSCIHYCLHGIKHESQLSSEDDNECSFSGLGIFCHAFNDLASDLNLNWPEYHKEIVKIKIHKHCLCHHVGYLNCTVHDSDTAEESNECDVVDFEEESISDDNEDSADEPELGDVLKDLLGDDDIIVECDGEWGPEFTESEMEEIDRIEKDSILLVEDEANGC
jgi:hypothetical protein